MVVKVTTQNTSFTDVYLKHYALTTLTTSSFYFSHFESRLDRWRLCTATSCVFILIQRRRNRPVLVDVIAAWVEETCSFKLICFGISFPEVWNKKCVDISGIVSRVTITVCNRNVAYAGRATVILYNWNEWNVMKMGWGTNGFYWSWSRRETDVNS